MSVNNGAINWDYNMVKEYVESTGCSLHSVEYKNMREPLIYKCRLCGDEFASPFQSFLKSKYHSCKKCASFKGQNHYSNNKKVAPNKYTLEKIREICLEKGVEFLSEQYNGIFEKHDFKCSCGNIFSTQWNSVVNAGVTKCKECIAKKQATARRLKIEDVRQRTSEMSTCELISDEYISAHKSLIFKCECGNIFKRSWANFTNKDKRLCSSCIKKHSAMERIAIDTLKEIGLEYVTQHWFDDCRYKYPLPFDLYIPSFNTCIELDGEHHFKPIEHFGGEEMFKIQQERDRIKNEYCEENNIQLVRIPYWEKNNINIILKNLFKQSSYGA